MSSIEQFPLDVQEVLVLMSEGKFLAHPYSGNKEGVKLLHDIHAAINLFIDQDVKRPYYFLPDIMEEANSYYEIPPPPNRLEEFARHRDEFKYFDRIKNNNLDLEKKINVGYDDFLNIVEMIYEDLVACAKARLYSSSRIPFFEELLNIYKAQGLPCGWYGSATPKKGKFVVFSR